MRTARQLLAAALLPAAITLLSACASACTSERAEGSAPLNAGPGTPKAEPSAVKVVAAAAQDWQAIDRLIEEQKLEQAAQAVALRRAQARERGDDEDLARTLVREVELRTALGGFETAVELLQSEEWPRQSLWRAVVQLFYAHSLVEYQRAYAWEILGRERVAAPEAVGLELWTREQIVGEALAAYAELWAGRAALGDTPVGALAEHVDANNYPASIRGTLRDAVSYLAVEMLADSALWSPAESQDVFTLDLEALLGEAPAAASWRLDDAALHPLVRLAAVLADLEAWHRGGHRQEAELEARLERSRRLFAAVAQPEDRARVRGDLERHLASHRRVAWWSMGQAELGEQLAAGEEPDALARALAVAREGERAYPGTHGARRCRQLAERIEAPEYELLAMAVDAPARRSLGVRHKNLAAIHLRAYVIDVERRVATSSAGPFPEGAELRDLVRAGRPVAAWSVELPATPDYRQHQTWIVPPLADRGVYLVVGSARADFGEDRNKLQGAPFLISDLILIERAGDRGEIVALSGAGGGPVAGATLRLYRREWRTQNQLLREAVTGADGTASLPVPARQPQILLGRHGADLAVLDGRWGGERDREPRQRSALVFTDRSIYRPQQRLLWKVLAFGGRSEEGKLAPLVGASVGVSLVDPNGETVETVTVATNDYGTGSGEFTVPAGRLLGDWTVTTSLGGATGVKVEEYKRPTFEVALRQPAEAARLNRTLALRGEARYYFGLPVAAGRVRWTATREPVWPWWQSWRFRPAPGTARVVAAGEAALDADGSFPVEFTPAADEREAAGDSAPSYRFTVRAEVTDEGGETRSATRELRLGFAAIEPRIETAVEFLVAGQPGSVVVHRVDLEGTPRAGAGRWRLIELEQPASARMPSEVPADPPVAGGFATPGDRLRPRWETHESPAAELRRFADGREVAAGTLAHGEDGRGTIALPPLATGAYRLRYETRDPFGATATAQSELVVAGADGRLALPAILLAERATVHVGDTARLLVHSGFPGQPLWLEIHRGGQARERRRLTGGTPHVVELPVGATERGGFVARLIVLRDHQLLVQEIPVAVPWDGRALDVELSTFRDLIRPGARETWRVTVRRRDGDRAAVAAAELLASMYDRSLDLFAPHQPADPFDLYPDTARAGWIRATLGQAPQQWIGQEGWGPEDGGDDLHGDRLRFYDSWGIGGPGRRHELRALGYVGGAPRVMNSNAQPAEAEAADAARPAPLMVGAAAKSAPAAPPAEAPAAEPPRSDFSETAFWMPHLLTGPDGSAAIEFTVPDSVTSWNVWVRALTRDLRAGSAQRETRSVKELLVRPYLPRFLREGDRAELRIAVNNASARPLEGTLRVSISDAETGEDLGPAFALDAAPRRFQVAPDGGTTLVVPLVAPRRPGVVAFRVEAQSGALADGELRPLPVLPSRLHLAQSRFAALRGGETRTLEFADLARPDPTRQSERLVVTLDAQLFYGVLAALPYLLDYPYECTEQTLNRFLSAGIVSSLFDRYPLVARMAAELGKRETRYETFDGADANRKMALEETPWLREARGGDARSPRGEEPDPDLVRVLDPRIARAERGAALAKLRKAQLPSGAFPWWPGGPPSPYMTLYVMGGLARAAEFDVEVPRDMVERGWSYLGDYFRRELEGRMADRSCGCVEFLTLLNYFANAYPDPAWTGDALTAVERTRILTRSFERWREHSPYLKGLLALTLKRMGRPEDARLVFDSVMDSALTTRDEGTFWRPEERSWLWYQDTIESHAFALRVLMELAPDDPRADGLVQWLFVNKKLNHWKSTRATSEVLYALAHYLERRGQLGAREAARVEAGGRETRFVFEPERFTGRKAQVVLSGAEVDAMSAPRVVVEQESAGLMFASATWHFATDELPATGDGDLFTVERSWYRRIRRGQEIVLEPLADGARLEPGDELEVQLRIGARAPAEYVHLRDPRAAGLEPDGAASGFRGDLGLFWYEETRDSATNFFFEALPSGTFTLKYRLRANLAGSFRVGPATLQSMYAPEFTAYSAGATLNVASPPGE